MKTEGEKGNVGEKPGKEKCKVSVAVSYPLTQLGPASPPPAEGARWLGEERQVFRLRAGELLA